jgi:hypothetical protein
MTDPRPNPSTLATLTGPADLRDQRWLDERIVTATNGIEAVIDIALNWSEGRCVGRLHLGVAPADYVRERVGLLGRAAIIPLLTESNWSNRQIAAVAGVSRSTVGREADELAQMGQLDRPTETLGADGKLRPRKIRPVVIDLETPDERSRSASYVRALHDYIAAIVRVQPPTLGDPPAEFRRRHELERRLQAVLAEVMHEGEAPWATLQSVVDSIGSLATTYDTTTIATAVPARRRAATAKRLRNLGRDLGRVAVALEQMQRADEGGPRP